MRASEFSRRRARIAHESNQAGGERRRRKALRALVKRSGARPIYSRRQVIAWRMPDDSVACVWKRYRTASDAVAEGRAIHATATHSVLPTRAYPCAFCDGWHLAR